MEAVMPLLSVLTPTIRGLNALRSVEQSLKKQSFDSWEWLIEYGDGKTSDLNAAYNRMLRRARGELVVFIDDWIWLDVDGLMRFWCAYLEYPKTFFTAPVPKAPSYYEAHGKIYWQGPVEQEWRSIKEGEIDEKHWEIDYGAAPLAALKEIGGFDEFMDQTWGNGNNNVALRARLAGYRFRNLPENSAVALKHDDYQVHPFRHKFDIPFWDKRAAEIEAGLKIEF
jgi:glycosyltransferase involved in cell wall biosynthesis